MTMQSGYLIAFKAFLPVDMNDLGSVTKAAEAVEKIKAGDLNGEHMALIAVEEVKPKFVRRRPPEPYDGQHEHETADQQAAE